MGAWFYARCRETAPESGRKETLEVRRQQRETFQREG